jgi:hypothetical protein
MIMDMLLKNLNKKDKCINKQGNLGPNYKLWRLYFENRSIKNEWRLVGLKDKYKKS